MALAYKTNHPITTNQFIDLLNRSTLGKRRPVHDYKCMEGMVKSANLTITAWDDDHLVGIARSVTDFHYACYLSDLAVCQSYQRLGVGKQLQELTQHQLGKHCKLILIAAPAADEYYETVGFQRNARCWVLPRDSRIQS